MNVIPVTIEELLKLYTTGQRDFTKFKVRATSKEMDGVNLSGAIFDNTIMPDGTIKEKRIVTFVGWVEPQKA